MLKPHHSNRKRTKSGAGCNAGVAKPSGQHDPDCASRTEADASAIAENVALYDMICGVA